MGYTVHLFALDADAFASELSEQSENILQQTRARLEHEKQLDANDIDYGLTLATAICRGDMPNDCSEDYFWSLCWIADTVLERIPLGVLISVKRFSYIREVGLWPLLERWQPPFAAPRSTSMPPGVGFLPHQQISATAIPFLGELSDQDVDATYARQQFVEVLESLDEDHLDLLAIVT